MPSLAKKVHAVAVLAGLLAALPASAATAIRTFVSASGSDANVCSISAPCRSFAAAAAATAPSGEIVVLDSAGYGPLTITQSLTITAPAGVYAGISVTSGNGVVIDTPFINVVLKGLTFVGEGPTQATFGGGLNGIVFSAGGSLTVENCEFANFLGAGIGASASSGVITIDGTTFRRNQNGVSLSGSVSATISHSKFRQNGSPSIAVTNAQAGYTAVQVADSEILGTGFYGAGVGIMADATITNGIVFVAVLRTTIINFGQGVVSQSSLSSGGTAIMILGQNTFNSTATDAVASGPAATAIIRSYGDNVMFGGAAPGTFSPMPAPGGNKQ